MACTQAWDFESPLCTIIVHDSVASNGLHRYHAHVVAPGMTPDLESGMPRNVYIEKRKGHFDLSDQVREAALDDVWSRRCGPDWRQRIPPLPGSLEEWKAELDDLDFDPPEPPRRRPARELPDIILPSPTLEDVGFDIDL